MTFSEYYEYYLSLHQNKMCRRLHVVGQITTITYIIVCIANSWWLPLFLFPFIVYPFAWTGHILFEKNEPLAWKGSQDYGYTTLRAKICDLIMLKDIITGKLEW